LGNQKSGTTAIAALLAMSTLKAATLDIRGIYEPVQTMLHSGKLSFMQFVRRNKAAFSRTIIKEPNLTFLYSKLKAHFPQAHYVIIVRDPRDNIRSVLNRLNINGTKPVLRSEEMAALSPEWQLMLNGQWLGLTGDTYIEQLAARWNLAADTYLQHRNEILLVRYEDFVKEKANTVYQLATNLNLPRLADISDKVDTQYQPRGQHCVRWYDFFGADNLRRIERICGSQMEHFGYSRTV